MAKQSVLEITIYEFARLKFTIVDQSIVENAIYKFTPGKDIRSNIASSEIAF
jgi:hypothetical protein